MCKKKKVLLTDFSAIPKYPSLDYHLSLISIEILANPSFEPVPMTSSLTTNPALTSVSLTKFDACKQLE